MAALTLPLRLTHPGATLAAAAPDRANRWAPLALAITIGAGALTLRAWNVGATLESSDQAALACLLNHSFGIRWIFAHDYGPVLPAIEAAWCRLLARLQWPIDERALRIPIVLMSLMQVGVTWPLMRRLGFARRCAWAACAAVALLPPLVSDAHYLWAYQTTALLFGSITLWTALAWRTEQRHWQLGVAAVSLFLHCLSGLYTCALPLTLLMVWSPNVSRDARLSGKSPDFRSRWAGPLVGFLLPCIAALAVIVGSWGWTTQGQLGRLMLKRAHGTAGLHPEQLLQLPRLWCSQLGPIFGAICAGAVVLRLARLRGRDTRALPAGWALASIVPFTLLADWGRIGYASHYTVEATFAAAIVGAAWLADAAKAGRYWKSVAIPLAAISSAQLGLASVDLGHPEVGFRAMTGVSAAWGEVRPDTGVKAAGYYVRQFVPDHATVLSLHGRSGMELPVAEYYCGRKVLATYDLPESTLPELWRMMQGRVDVVLTDPARASTLAGSDLRCVCMLRRGGRLVRMVFARPELGLPRRDCEVSVMNAEYDRECVPRHIPVPLPAPADFLEDLRLYQRTVAELRGARRTARAGN